MRAVARSILPVALAAMFACGRGPDLDAGRAVMADPGLPLPGLTATDSIRFAAGRLLFHHEFTVAEGLGPIFNQKRCSSCHDLPGLGGYGAEPVQKATRWDAARGTCDLLAAGGGDVIQGQVTDSLRAAGVLPEALPAGATAIARIKPPALFGTGLIDAIPAPEILARVDSADADGDGISGRAGHTADGRFGRFGRRGEFASLRDFVAGALLLEMGLTTAEHPVEERRNGEPNPAGWDPATDPEISADSLDLLVDFVRFLAVPAMPAGSPAFEDTLRAGRRAFDRAGCNACHTPTMTTGPGPDPALDRKTVALYSDLLLHDLGPALNSICGLGAGPSEFRTAPLMGLRLRQPFLHDGRAASLEEAIAAHGGEAEPSRTRFDGLDPAARQALLRLLRAL
ncbi:MAG: di-heme oxidoredictase family protein [Gemmatimonadota bacterium]|jgi:CxxC motif-containing protein (DUF1111 family)